MAKTKADLEREISELHNQLKTANDSLDDAKRIASKEDSARELFEVYQSYMTVGFTKEQAWELTKILIDNGTKPKKSLF